MTITTIELKLGQTMRHLREEAGVSKRDMAELLDVHTNTITNYEKGVERGGTEPNKATCVLWAQACDADPDLLIRQLRCSSLLAA